MPIFSLVLLLTKIFKEFLVPLNKTVNLNEEFRVVEFNQKIFGRQVVGSTGLVGNIYSLFLFARQKVHRIFHNLLLLLAIFDLVRFIAWPIF